MKDKVCKITNKLKYNNSQDRLHNLLQKELRKYVSDDIIYSQPFWSENDAINENIDSVKDTIQNNIIRNKYKRNL